jgi:hypothetical protein
MPDRTDNSRAGLSTTTIVTDSERVPSHGSHIEVIALVVAWSAAEPERIGELAILMEGGTPLELGRGPGENPSDQRVRFFRQRPSSLTEAAPFSSPGDRKSVV